MDRGTASVIISGVPGKAPCLPSNPWHPGTIEEAFYSLRRLKRTKTLEDRTVTYITLRVNSWGGRLLSPETSLHILQVLCLADENCDKDRRTYGEREREKK